MIELVGDAIDEAFLNAVKGIQVKVGAKKEIKIVFTPLHGTSGYLGSKLLTDLGYDYVAVKEQMVPDGDFSTVKSPNPENASAFELAIKYAKEAHADLVIKIIILSQTANLLIAWMNLLILMPIT